MKYSIELVVAKVKTAWEISKEIANGTYDGSSTYYQGKMKLGDQVVAEDLVLGDSDLEKEALEKIVRERASKYDFDNNKKDTIDLTSEGAKVVVKNVTDERFHTILRQFDYIK
ncbi:MAG TPA: hypothetical protein VM577_12505, partial [Anaerovoracaceae bacterium]|nr:hypothetical protein [Anaerovoracaceae bacterium]